MFYQAGMPPPPQSEANRFLPATIVPPIPQSTQSGAEIIEEDHILPQRNQEVTSTMKLNEKDICRVTLASHRAPKVNEAPTQLKS